MSRSEDLVLIGGGNNASGNNPEEILNLMRGVFQMCDVHRSGHITIDDLLTLGQQYLGQDTKVSRSAGLLLLMIEGCGWIILPFFP